MHPYLGVSPAQAALLYVICSPVGPYYASGFKPVSLYADTRHVRAWPGGSGAHKLGANYGPCIAATRQAADRGYAQVLWLFGADHQVTEVGTMNLFFVWRAPHDPNGRLQLVTPALGDMILPGVTRDTILTLCKQNKQYTSPVVGTGAISANQAQCLM